MAGRTELKFIGTYLKDLSFQNFKDERFLEPGTSPELSVNIGVRHARLQSARHQYEVVLTIDITANEKGEKIYNVEVEQGGLFEFRGDGTNDQPERMLDADCPTMLFPFVRETVSAIVIKGGFPRLILNPSIRFVPSRGGAEEAVQTQESRAEESGAGHDTTDS